MHSDHIVATKVLMPMEGVCVFGKVHSDHIVATKVLMPGGGVCVSRTVHSEHSVATKVLMPVKREGWVSGKVHSEHIGRFRAGGKQPRIELPSCFNLNMWSISVHKVSKKNKVKPMPHMQKYPTSLCPF